MPRRCRRPLRVLLPRDAMMLFLVASLGFAGAAPQRPAEDPARVRREVRIWRERNEASILRSFAELLQIPNVASDKANIERNAEAIRKAFEARGAKTEL